MKKQKLIQRVCGAVACAALTMLSGSRAHAAGFDSARFGSVHGNATGATPFALYYNPAALATTERIHIAGNLTLALRGATFARAGSDTSEPADAAGANTGKATLFNVLSAPALAASMRFGDWAVGLGFFVPMGGQASWEGGSSNPKYPGVRDGSARWWMIDGTTSVLYTTAGASYTVRPLRLSFGASANLTYSTVDFTRGLTGQFTDAINSEGRTHVNVNAVSGSFGLGTLWEALPQKLWLGLSYQAPPGLYKEQKLDGKMQLAFTENPSRQDVTMHVGLPDVIRFGVRARPQPNYELRFNGDFTRWSTLQNQCLTTKGTDCNLGPNGSDPSADHHVIANQVRDWKNAVGLRGGGSYYITPTIEAFAQLGFDSGAVRMRTLEPGIVDGVSMNGTVGGRIRIANLVSLLLSYDHQGYFARDSTGKNRLASYSFPSNLPDAGGKYTQWIGTFNGMVEVHLP